MKQFFIKFTRNACGDTLTEQVNSFIENHQNYKVKDFQYIHPEASTVNEFLMVLFELEEDD